LQRAANEVNDLKSNTFSFEALDNKVMAALSKISVVEVGGNLKEEERHKDKDKDKGDHHHILS